MKRLRYSLMSWGKEAPIGSKGGRLVNPMTQKQAYHQIKCSVTKVIILIYYTDYYSLKV